MISKNTIICPNCEHVYTEDELYNNIHDGIDIYKLPELDKVEKIKCVKCKLFFYVRGSYIPVYETSIDEI